ncbi:MAG TPA: hypothetical protein PK414_01640 [Anaerolineales bacterium]|nr:hypothetical protein [Anaerolineales bacterium]
MTLRKKRFVFVIVLLALILTACTPKTNVDATPTIDSIGTIAADLASMMLTQTAAAYTPTPLPPTETPLPVFTDTPTLEPSPAVTGIPIVSGNAPCYKGPGENYGLVSNITDTKEVEFIGTAHVTGWYVIRNPYYGSLCWIRVENLNLSPDFDISAYPTVMP